MLPAHRLWQELARAGGHAVGRDHRDQGPDARAQVAAVVRHYGAAVADRDYKTVCDDLLAPELLSGLKAQGVPCQVAFQKGLETVLGPKLRLLGVEVRGESAYARTHTTATNQPPSDDTLLLRRLSGRWRIASLSSPAPRGKR